MEKTKKSNNPVEIFMHGLMFIFGMMSVAFVLRNGMGFNGG